MSEDQTSKRDFVHIQNSPYRFQSQVYAPEKNGNGKPRFAVEVLVYVSGLGMDAINPMTSGNELMIMFRDYVRLKELMGYKHLGLSSDQITNVLKNLWGVESV